MSFSRRANNLIISDLTEIVRTSEDDMNYFGKSSWTVFGGSGFVGRWLTASLLFSSEYIDTEFEVTVVTRDKTKSLNNFQQFIQSDLFEPKYITVEEFLGKNYKLDKKEIPNYCIFGATPTTNIPRDLLDITRYFHSIIDIVSDIDNPPVVMNLSSGAVYKNAFGRQESILEDDEIQVAGQGINLYQECKISIEDILSNRTKAGLIKGVNPRLFSFAGPGFPLNSHFAVSNFIMSCLNRTEICITGHPKTSRSYMDPVDMTSWLLRLLRMHENIGLNPIHIGSDSPICMDELASIIQKIFVGKNIRYTQGLSAIPNSYVPSTAKTRELLGVGYNWNLERTLSKWRDFIGAKEHTSEFLWE